MADYRKMYHILFNEITDAVEKLKEAQGKTEEIYMSSEDTPLHLEKNEPDKGE